MDPNAPIIFSPFSSKARRLASHRDEILNDDAKPLFGFQNCRSVSVLLKIGTHPNNTACDDDCPDEEGYGPILFPMKDGDRREIVLVNPNAFEDGDVNNEKKSGWKKIAGKVTVETARLVAEVVRSLLRWFNYRNSSFFL